MDEDLPEVGDIAYADLMDEMDDFANGKGFGGVNVQERNFGKMDEKWIGPVDKDLQGISAARQREVDDHVEFFLGKMREAGIDPTDEVAVHAFLWGGYMTYAFIRSQTAAECHDPEDPLLHIDKGGYWMGTVAVALRRGVTT